jgi:hypothetical protein
MVAFLAGICIKTDTNICAPGSFQIKAIYALAGGFLFVALIGLLWLGNSSKRR